jgi:DNA polymerase-4
VRPDRIRKSAGAENTFNDDLVAYDAMCAELAPIIDKVWRYCETTEIRGRTVTLKVKFADFQIITRRHTLALPVADRGELERVSFELLAQLCPVPKGVRLLGVTLSNLEAPGEAQHAPLQMSLL